MSLIHCNIKSNIIYNDGLAKGYCPLEQRQGKLGKIKYKHNILNKGK